MSQIQSHVQPNSITLTPASPAFWGAAGGMLIGVGLFAYALYLFTGDSTPKTLNVALMVIALAEASTAHFTLKGSRVAWAFALSINGTCSVVLLFAAPRIRDAADISIALALLPCIVLGILVLLHSLKPEDF